MLKKTGLILLALTLAAGMVFVGCGDSGGGGDVEDYIVDLSGLTVTSSSLTAQNAGFMIELPAYPSNFNINNYSKITVDATFEDYDEDPITADWGKGGLKFGKVSNGQTKTNWDTTANYSIQINNLGVNANDHEGAGFRNASKGYVLNAAEKAAMTTELIQAIWLFKSDTGTSGTGVSKITLTQIKFHN